MSPFQTLITVYSFAFPLVAVYMSLWFIVALIKKDNGLADTAWGIGFALLAIASYSQSMQVPRSFLLTLMVIVWGARLAIHIYTRNHGKPEDFRYAAWRQSWGHWFVLRSFLQIFMLQGVLLVLISTPVLFAHYIGGPALRWLDLIGFLIWLTGFIFESLGDYQLRQFGKNPANKGHIISTGLWKYTRHPNYFGEVSQWWGVFIVALSVPGAWISIIGPLTISFLILKVSGIPMLEKKFEGNPEFESYKARTNAFFPWFPKSPVSSSPSNSSR